MNNESVTVEQEKDLPIPLSMEDLDTVMEYYSSPRAVTWDRDAYFKAVFQTAKEAKAENAALTTQLEEAEGKLSMVSYAASKYRSLWVCGWIRGVEEHREEVLQCFKGIEEALNALSPDIKRYREEIEREAREKAIQDVVSAINADHFSVIGKGVTVEVLQSLLPKQKEVSNEI